MESQFVRAVEDCLASALSSVTQDLPAIAADAEGFLNPARTLLEGGKRTRARLVRLGWLAVTGQEPEPGGPAVQAGCAVELFQAAALVHDDIIDDADTRRGRPAAHRTLGARHGEVFGRNAAILLGDALLALAERSAMLAASATPSFAAALRDWHLMTVEVAIGQYLDVEASVLPLPDGPDPDSLTRALTVLRHKSAHYSVVWPLRVGAALAGADDDLLASLTAVAEPLGEAFQLRDDHLGVFGDPSVTGKPAGDDLMEGKRTPLVLLGLAEASHAGRELIRGALGKKDLDRATVDQIRTELRESGAVDRHEDMISERYSRALAALADARLPEIATAELEAMAGALTAREY